MSKIDFWNEEINKKLLPVQFAYQLFHAGMRIPRHETINYVQIGFRFFLLVPEKCVISLTI